MTEKTEAAKSIDIRDEVCPYTFIKSKLAIEEMDSGDLLEIVVNHAPAVENVPRSMENEGHEIVGVDESGPGEWKITVRKK